MVSLVHARAISPFVVGSHEEAVYPLSVSRTRGVAHFPGDEPRELRRAVGRDAADGHSREYRACIDHGIEVVAANPFVHPQNDHRRDEVGGRGQTAQWVVRTVADQQDHPRRRRPRFERPSDEGPYGSGIFHALAELVIDFSDGDRPRLESPGGTDAFESQRPIHHSRTRHDGDVPPGKRSDDPARRSGQDRVGCADALIVREKEPRTRTDVEREGGRGSGGLKAVEAHRCIGIGPVEEPWLPREAPGGEAVPAGAVGWEDDVATGGLRERSLPCHADCIEIEAERSRTAPYRNHPQEVRSLRQRHVRKRYGRPPVACPGDGVAELAVSDEEEIPVNTSGVRNEGNLYVGRPRRPRRVEAEVGGIRALEPRPYPTSAYLPVG